MIKGISSDLLHRYVAMRCKVDAEAKTIHSLVNLLALLRYSESDVLKVDPVALSQAFQTIEHSILNIWSSMDDFIGIAAARLALAELEPSEEH